MRIRPFRPRVSEATLHDLRERLSRARWPDEMDESPGEDGVERAFLRALAAWWRNRFDWRSVEARIRALPNFVAEIDGLEIHFVRVRGRGPRSSPLLLIHGWPGSFLEMLELIPLLADPSPRGGDFPEAFDLVVPSLPGYGFSERPRRRGWHTAKIAGALGKLMAGLGYARYGIQGGDWGATIATRLAMARPERVAGIHLNYIPGSYAPALGPGARPLSADEESFRRESQRWWEEEGAYAHLQATRPQTLAYGLHDSPVGLLAWMVEKFRDWSDCGGKLWSRFTRTQILSHVTLYWLTGTFASSSRLYKEARAVPLRFEAGERVSVPCAVARFPKEAPMPPREWVERHYDVVRWTEMPRGGHFAAMEEPEALAEDVREFFGGLRV